MKKKPILLVTPLFMAFCATVTLPDVTLTINPHTLCLGSTNNVVPLIQDNPEEAITSLQVDIFFDTDCFTVTSVERSSRSDVMDLFIYSAIEGGIRIAMSNCFHSSSPGTGPIAHIIVDVQSDCLEGDFNWDMQDATAQSLSGEFPPLTEIDGTITVSDCESCSLQVPATDFDLGDFMNSYSISTWIDISNVGPSPGYVIIKDKGCASADPSEFTLDPNSSETVKITCRPIGTGPCEGTLTLIGCRDNIILTVRCNRVPSTVNLSIRDQVVFQDSENNTTMLDMENNIEVSGLETYILFDTTCFDITTVNRTERSRVLSIFLWEKIEGGIDIGMTCIGHQIDPGSGPIAEIVFNVKNGYANQYVWDVTESKATTPLSILLSPTEFDGTITVLEGHRGDIDGNGHVNIIDAFWGMRIVLEELPDPTTRELEAADCNKDGEIDITDVLGIVNIVLEIGTCPP